MPGKPGFWDNLRTEHLGGRWHRLTYRLRYKSQVTNSILTVPAGFITDFASVPRLPVIYWLFGSKTDEAAVIHDYLYRYTQYDKDTADLVYLEAMRCKGTPLPTRLCMYLGVRWFGWWSFGANEGALDPRNGG